jgi:hypothetical protein
MAGPVPAIRVSVDVSAESRGCPALQTSLRRLHKADMLWPGMTSLDVNFQTDAEIPF